MPTADEWRDARDAVAGSGGLDRSEHTPRLYELAVEDGSRSLARAWSYSDEQSIDLIHDTLMEAWGEVMRAESPRALFLKVLAFRAIDRHRKRGRERGLPPADVETTRALTGESVTAPIHLEEALGLLEAELSPRDVRVFIARTVCGEATRAVARAEGLSEANVHQIVCRGRKRLKEHLDADPG